MSIPLRQLLVMGFLLAAGAWSAATIHLQTELFPIFPQDLASVRGLTEAQRIFAAEREAIVVLSPRAPVPNKDYESAIARFVEDLRKNPDVESVADLRGGLPASPQKSAAWLIATLPPEKFAQFQSAFSPEQLETRLQKMRANLSGALDEETVARLRFDPLGLSEDLELQTGLKLPAAAARPSIGVVSIMARSVRPLTTFEDCQKFVASVRNTAFHSGDLSQKSIILLTGGPAFVAETSMNMKRDMIRMIALAVILVCVVFWIFYRSFVPLIWIVLLQSLAMLSGLIAARIIFGELNVLSMGFATIILGVGMDYCILVYHHHLHGDDLMWATLRRSIWLSAITTAASFGILFFSSFPGFKQLSLLIAVGLLTTAWLATSVLPHLLKSFHPRMPRWIEKVSDAAARSMQHHRWMLRWIFFGTCVALICLYPLWRSYPFYDADLNRLQPTQSEAYRGQKMLREAASSEKSDPPVIIVEGSTWDQVREKIIGLGKSKSLDLSSSLLWIPREEILEQNRISWKPGKEAAMDRAFEKAGLGPAWGATTKGVLSELDRWSAGEKNFTEIQSFGKHFTGEANGRKYFLLRLTGTACAAQDSTGEFWAKMLSAMPDALPVSWELLKTELSSVAQKDFRRLSSWMILLILLLCIVIHRSGRLVAFNLFALASAFLILLAMLRLTETSMSLLSLLAVPLLIGLVIDYSLHMLLALEHSSGDLRATFRHLAVPVCLTGLTSMIGFGSPMITRQPALQNFGFVMDLGVFSAVLAGLVLLPAFYFPGRQRLPYSRLLYRASLLGIASKICGMTGLRAARKLGWFFGNLYARLNPEKTEIVRKNQSLLTRDPVTMSGARCVFASFGSTMADYLTLGARSKERATQLIQEKEGIEHLERAHREGNGCLIVTAHFGLFELGGLLLTNVGFPTTILTLPEPTRALTDWRAKYRKRWGIDTLEVGEEEFSFLNIVRELHAGKFVAVLADRPYQSNYVPVDFPNGRVPFSSGPVLMSLLARCPIIPGAIMVLPSGGYRMRAYPPLYPHLHSGSRDETIRFFTQEIARALLPALCQYPEQWYQFGRIAG